MLEYVLRPAAVADIRRAYLRYEQGQPGLGEDFLRRVHATLLAVRNTPRAFPVVHRDTRRAFVSRFPYGFYYRILGGVVVFVACYHTRRHERGWQGRR